MGIRLILIANEWKGHEKRLWDVEKSDIRNMFLPLLIYLD